MRKPKRQKPHTYKILIQILINKNYILHYTNNITLLMKIHNILNYGLKVMKNIKTMKNFYKTLAALKLNQEKQKLHTENQILKNMTRALIH